ncbi:ABC transporter permease subunit [Vreelandella olivaria]|uniref:ABC transporter permease subunit n=1 Tax=Vreelandella olivaria TaxID=390919 RepID=UPI00201F4A59|nr:ABC transporter permease subunit [Halomonas olivaria]
MSHIASHAAKKGGFISGPHLSLDKVLVVASILIPLVCLLLFFGYPLYIVLIRSLTLPDGTLGLVNYAQVFSNATLVSATLNSLVLSAMTMLISLLLGFAIAYRLERTSAKGRAFVTVALALPLLAPSLVQGLGLIFIFGRNGLINQWFGISINPYGFYGLLMANILYALPQVVLIIQAALRQSDARLYEAAGVMGATNWEKFRDITLPNAKFGLISAGFVAFTVTITDFGNAAVIGGDFRVLATEIYNQVAGQMNFSMGAVVGILLLIPTVVAVGVERFAARKQSASASESAIPVQPDTNTWRDVLLGALTHSCSAMIYLVIGVTVFASFVDLWPYRMELTLRHYNISMAGGYTPLWMSLWISLLAASLGVVLIFLMAVSMKKLPAQIGRIVNFIAIMPVGVPGLVLGLAYILAFNTGGPLTLLYGTPLLIGLCNLYHYHSQGFLTMMTGLRGVPVSLEDTCTCFGGGMKETLRDAVFPFMLTTCIAVFFFLFMRSMVSLSAVIFLITPSINVAPVAIMQLSDAGRISEAAAFSTCLMLLVVTAMLLLRWLIKKVPSPDKRS